MKAETTQLYAFTLITLFAFAANSVLCRLALNTEQVSPLDFSVVRLISAAVTLLILIMFKSQTSVRNLFSAGSKMGALYLFVYIVGFSYAYVTLSTSTGALILFAAVQFTMLFKGWLNGNKMSKIEQLGVGLSIMGFIYFVYPELEKPSLSGCILMLVAGIAWGFYSLTGAKSTAPFLDTASNFIRLLPIALLGLIVSLTFTGSDISQLGLVYTITAGAIASGLGYTLWYTVLPKLNATSAAVSQLSVPIWAAFGGVIWVAEPISWHLILSSLFILGGILLSILSKKV